MYRQIGIWKYRERPKEAFSYFTWKYFSAILKPYLTSMLWDVLKRPVNGLINYNNIYSDISNIFFCDDFSCSNWVEL